MINNIYVHNSPIICINGHYISHYYQDIECGCGRVYVLERERERRISQKKVVVSELFSTHVKPCGHLQGFLEITRQGGETTGPPSHH